ncbi:MAG: RIP metalloprotease RseP [Opitutaceae bacterium]|nr:RIP metalloprotease RseP [Opitutaceae bacterium]
MSSDLLQSLASSLWSIFLIVLFFGGSIFVHELGHFLAARRRGVRVERFSIGFGPKIFAWRGQDGVEYRVSWLPLGGYVLLPQLADMGAIEGGSETDLTKLPPVGYITKMLVFAAGAVFNILFAFLLACIVWFVGQPTSSELKTTKIGLVLPTIALPDGSTIPSPAFEAGFQVGDIIRAIDGNRVTNWPDLQQTLFAGGGRSADGRPKAVFTVERDGQTLELTVYPRLAGDERMRRIGIAPAEEFTVYEVKPGSPAAQAGLKMDDKIVALDGLPVFYSSTFADYLRKSIDRPVTLIVLRAGRQVTLTVSPRPKAKDVAELGLTFRSGYELVYPSPFAQIQDNVVMTFRVLAGLINPQSDLSVSKLSGPVGIMRVFAATAQSDIRLVLWFTILVNVNLAIFNLLPIPVLDGGHMLFATIGRLRGQALPANFIMAAQSVFMVLLFSLILYVSFFDVRRWARDARAEQAESPLPAAAVPAAP